LGSRYPSIHIGSGKVTITLEQPLPSSSSESTDNGSGGGYVVSPPSQSTSNRRAVYVSHAVVLILSWGVFAPVSVSAAVLRKVLGFPRWMTIHKYGNMLTYVLTLVGVAMVIIVNGGKVRFNNMHFVWGWVIVGVASVQVVAGFFRPGTEKKNLGGGVVVDYVMRVKEGSVRAVWELAHRAFALLLFGVAMFQGHTGFVSINE